jgi:hypothetical protein
MSERRVNFFRRMASLLKRANTETDCLHMAYAAWSRLRELGWQDITYCPKDGSLFLSISAGSTGIHETYYEGEWPDGSWWVNDGGDTWPAHPTMWKPKT